METMKHGRVVRLRPTGDLFFVLAGLSGQGTWLLHVAHARRKTGEEASALCPLFIPQDDSRVFYTRPDKGGKTGPGSKPNLDPSDVLGWEIDDFEVAGQFWTNKDQDPACIESERLRWKLFT
jgi:hypothetical protein